MTGPLIAVIIVLGVITVATIIAGSICLYRAVEKGTAPWWFSNKKEE